MCVWVDFYLMVYQSWWFIYIYICVCARVRVYTCMWVIKICDVSGLLFYFLPFSFILAQ